MSAAGSSFASERDLSECSKLWLVCSLRLPVRWLCCLAPILIVSVLEGELVLEVRMRLLSDWPPC